MAAGRVAIVTGGLGGIGKCYIKSLLKEGAKGVSIWDIDDKCAKNFLDELEKEFGYGKAIFFKVDMSDNTQIENAYEKTVAHFDQLDIVVNNAGIVNEENVKKVIQINLVSVILSTNLAVYKYLPKYRKFEDATVVNTASIAGLEIYDYIPTYVASKHGVVAYTRCLGSKDHFEFTKIRVMCICPGYTDTPLIICMNQPEHLKRVSEKKTGDREELKIQSPEVVGDALIAILKKGQTGSAWLARLGVIKEFDFQDRDNSIVQQFTY